VHNARIHAHDFIETQFLCDAHFRLRTWRIGSFPQALSRAPDNEGRSPGGVAVRVMTLMLGCPQAIMGGQPRRPVQRHLQTAGEAARTSAGRPLRPSGQFRPSLVSADVRGAIGRPANCRLSKMSVHTSASDPTPWRHILHNWNKIGAFGVYRSVVAARTVHKQTIVQKRSISNRLVEAPPRPE
jgi:hypothetical protein